MEISDFIEVPQLISTHESLNLPEERSMVVFGPHVEEQDPSTPTFYITLVIHDLLLHNCMLD